MPMVVNEQIFKWAPAQETAQKRFPEYREAREKYFIEWKKKWGYGGRHKGKELTDANFSVNTREGEDHQETMNRFYGERTRGMDRFHSANNQWSR